MVMMIYSELCDRLENKGKYTYIFYIYREREK